MFRNIAVPAAPVAIEILPSAVGAAQPLSAFDSPGSVVIEPSEPGVASCVLHFFVAHIASALLLHQLNEQHIPSHVLCLFVPYATVEFLLNALDIPVPSVLHTAVPVQPDVLYVDALPLHIFPAVPNPRSDQDRHEHDSAVIDGI